MLTVAMLEAGGGRLALSPLPGQGGSYAEDLAVMVALAPALVLSLTTAGEMTERGAGSLGADLAVQGIGWVHYPVADYGVPAAEELARWPSVAAQAREVVAAGGMVLAHCLGGCGRSGMAVLRLMVEAGEEPSLALARLRAVRPCAVETAAQFDWAAAGATLRDAHQA